MATNGAPKRLARCSTNATPAIVAPVIMTSSKNRPAAVTGAPVMTSPTGADTADQAVDGRQSAEVDRPGLDDVQRAGRCRCRPAVYGHVDRRVDDIDLATLDAIRAGGGRHLVHRGGGRRPGRQQEGAD